MKRSHLLIVDDNPHNIQLAAAILKEENYALFFATSGAEGLAIIEKEPIDLVLMDIMMPEMDGFEATQHIKKMQAHDDIAVIFVTAKNDEKSIALAYESGGVDYITKPYYDVELIARVKTHLKIKQMAEELKASAEKLYTLANTDPLTGIANRLKFNTIAQHQIVQAHRYRQELSIIFFDIDHFKRINDEMGHDFGDRVLVSIGKNVQKTIRQSDLLARWGGEEFVIIMPITEKIQAAQTAEKLRFMIAQHTMELRHVTCSFGVAQLMPGEDLAGIMRRADNALYRAKSQGRNQVVID